METFEIQVSGNIIVQAKTYEDAVAQADKALADVLTDWELN